VTVVVGGSSDTGELRIDDLARAAGITVRNARAYQDRGLLPPPRREGRVAWYGPAHLARLRVIGSLLDRGFTLASIAELLHSWSEGEELGSLLGVGQQLLGTFSDEVPDVGTIAEIVDRYDLGLEDTDAMASALSLGLVELDGDTLRVPSPRLLRAGVELQRSGVPTVELFAELHRLRADIEAMAERFVRLVVAHVVEPRLVDGLPAADDAHALATTLDRVRPLATTVVTAELARALQARTEAELGARLAQALERAAPTPGTS